MIYVMVCIKLCILRLTRFNEAFKRYGSETDNFSNYIVWIQASCQQKKKKKKKKKKEVGKRK